LIKNFRADSDFSFSNAIVIAIEKPIRIDRTLIEYFRADFDFSFSNAIVIVIGKPIRIDLPR